METLGQRIRTAREQAGYSREDLMVELRAYPTLEKVSTNTIQAWENGETAKVSLQAIVAISRLTNTPISYFIDVLDVPEAPPGAPERGGTVRAPKPAPARRRYTRRPLVTTTNRLGNRCRRFIPTNLVEANPHVEKYAFQIVKDF